MGATKLTEADRAFFGAVARVVYGNPYNPDRAALIAGLLPNLSPAQLARDREALARTVAGRVAPWLAAGGLATPGLGEEDRALLEPALVYVCYQRWVPQFDAHIARQARATGAPIAVDFADEALADLGRHGFSESRAQLAFALFFQLRRTFYFIERELTGACDSMQRLREALWNNVFTHDLRGYADGLWNRMEDFATLLLGETGTGKGSAAAAIGRSEFIPYLPGPRRFGANFADSFIAINLSQYPEGLIESELFGHRKGAFTGAIDHHDGVFARCSAHGALFLDEIGEVSIPVQIKLLQVLQERTFTPLGGHEKQRFSGRVIAATNRPLAKLREDGAFRDDFFYRLCSDVIEVPTLRQRIAESPTELENLVHRLVLRIAGDSADTAIDGVLAALAAHVPRQYPWPGNVRELEQAVRRILLTGRYVPDASPPASSPDHAVMEHMRQGRLTAEQLLKRYCAMLYRRLGTYADVARRTGLDPRTTRKYVEEADRG